MEEIIKRLGKYFISLERSSIEWTAAGIVKTGKKITDVQQHVKYVHDQDPKMALLKLETELVNYYLKQYKVNIINKK